MVLRSDPPGSNPVLIFGIPVPLRAVRWLARIWISAVIVGSLLPGPAKAILHVSQGGPPRFRSSVDLKHRLIHFAAFGSSLIVLSLLANGRREQLKAAGEVMIIGCLVELAQYFIYLYASQYRHALEWWDVRDDAIGIAVAFLLVQIASRVNSTITLRS